MTPMPWTFEVAFPSEAWARYVADALTAAGWLATTLALDAAHVQARRPDLAAMLPADLLVCWLVLAGPPDPLPAGNVRADVLPTAGDLCARCSQPLDPEAGPVKIGDDWHHRGCLTAEEADCILDRPPRPADPRAEDGPDG